MNKKIFFGRSLKDVAIAVGPSTFFILCALIVAYIYLDPAPPSHLVIATGGGEGDYMIYAKLYKEILKKEGVDLEIRTTGGPVENLQLLEDENSNVDVGFVQDGLGNIDQQPDLVSLGSLYQEPIWIFYRNGSELTRLSQLEGKSIAIGPDSTGTNVLAKKLFQESGVDEKNAKFVPLGLTAAANSLRQGLVDAAVFLGNADDPLVEQLVLDPSLRLMNFDQAEAITRQIPYLHHLILPHGAFDLKRNLPAQDVHLVSPAATLVARDDLHPALVFLLLKAATQVHGAPGVFEKKDEFPTDREFTFPLDRDAKAFYKSGAPFWQRHLPYWLASLVDRFIIIMIPILALVLPLIRLVPKIYVWRIKSKIYKRYGELKFLEMQLKPETTFDELPRFLSLLDEIEVRVNQMKVPVDYSDHIYVLREHIDFVRGRLVRGIRNPKEA